MSELNLKALAAAVAGAVAVASFAAPSFAQGMGDSKGKEKCYGVSKAGENQCASANGSHSCQAQSKADFDGNEWKYVESGTCAKMGGKAQGFQGKGTPMEKKGS